MELPLNFAPTLEYLSAGNLLNKARYSQDELNRIMANLKYLRVDKRSASNWNGEAPMLERFEVLNYDREGFPVVCFTGKPD